MVELGIGVLFFVVFVAFIAWSGGCAYGRAHGVALSTENELLHEVRRRRKLAYLEAAADVEVSSQLNKDLAEKS